MRKKQKIFMPPHSVREADKLGPESISLDEVQKLYQSGSKASIRWARRILRQEGILKASKDGEVHIPVAIDLQLGPEIFVGISSQPTDEVIAKFDEAGISASCVPCEGNTFAFFTEYPDEIDEVHLAEFPVKKVDNRGLVMIDESKAKIKSIMRAVWKSKDTVGFHCFAVEDPSEVVSGVQFDKVFLLKTPDSSCESAQIIKVDKTLGLVLGWGIISTIHGMPYFDKQGDHIPDESMLEAAADYMINSRVQGDMHVKDKTTGIAKSCGTVVFCWPLTTEIAKAFGIDTDQTGLMIAVKPDSDEILRKYEDGTYTGFSIGGQYDPDFTEEVA